MEPALLIIHQNTLKKYSFASLTFSVNNNKLDNTNCCLSSKNKGFEIYVIQLFWTYVHK